MFCTKCGQQVEDGMMFCTRCGSSLSGAPQQPTAPPPAAPYYPGYAQGYPAAQPKKSNKGLIIGLSVGAGVLAILAVVLFVFILPGSAGDIAGKWYDQSGYGTIEFLGGGKVNYEAAGLPMSGTYTYDAKSKSGTMTVEMMGMSQDADFALEGDMLYVDGSYFTREYVEQQDISDMLGDFGLDGSSLDGLDMGDFNLDDYDMGDLSDYNMDDLFN